MSCFLTNFSIALLLFSSIALAKNESIKTLKSGDFSTIYSRSDWPHWIDIDHDCKDTRAEFLIKNSKVPVKLSRNRCRVLKGNWFDNYTGVTISIANDLDVDHIVPLSWAHGHGGDKWSIKKRKNFANDFENLLAVSVAANRSKGDKGPDDWMPPNHKFRCAYLKRFDDVVRKYGVLYAPQERRIIYRMKTACNNK